MEKTTGLVHRLAKKLFAHNEYYIFTSRSLEELPAERPLPPTLRIMRLDSQNAGEMEQWEGLPANKRRDFRRMLAQGQIGFFALDGNQVAGHVWAIVNRGGRVINRGYVRVYPGEAYVHYAHTYPPYRRQGIAFDLVLRLLYDILAMPDIHMVKASVLSHNTPSLTMLETLRGQRVGRILFWRILGIPFRKVRLEQEGTGARW